MENKEFVALRKQLNKTQKELAILLGVSLKAISSYEQGWRTIPHHVERQLFYLVSQKKHWDTPPANACWEILTCPEEKRENCPSWEFQTTRYCWMINGIICHGKPQASWAQKIALCRQCEVFKETFK